MQDDGLNDYRLQYCKLMDHRYRITDYMTTDYEIINHIITDCRSIEWQYMTKPPMMDKADEFEMQRSRVSVEIITGSPYIYIYGRKKP